ncbi:hypothetical protein DAI22_03g345650 [Oryza sativa Japonica Group]|nr:hypothetical protein DAI22_03g345650 [Oryza sativa Japonica Group]
MAVVVPARLFVLRMLRVVRLNPLQRGAASVVEVNQIRAAAAAIHACLLRPRRPAVRSSPRSGDSVGAGSRRSSGSIGSRPGSRSPREGYTWPRALRRWICSWRPHPRSSWAPELEKASWGAPRFHGISSPPLSPAFSDQMEMALSGNA